MATGRSLPLNRERIHFGFNSREPRLKYVQRWDILYTSTSRLPVLSHFIPLSDDRIYSRLYAHQIPLALFSVVLSSLFLFSLFKVESPSIHPPSLCPPRDVHYRNVSVTAVKNVNSPYRRHCPVDAKCSFGRNTDRRFRAWGRCCYSRSSSSWGESWYGSRSMSSYFVNLALILSGLFTIWLPGCCWDVTKVLIFRYLFFNV